MTVFHHVDKEIYSNSLSKDILKVFAGSLFLVLSSQIAVYLPFSPLAMTFQTVALFLMGIYLGPIQAGLAVLLYLAEGALGFPVFALGRGGLGVLLGPKGGYYIGFLIAAVASGLFANRNSSFLRLAISFMLANLSIYALGLPWLGLYVGFDAALSLGFYPFVFGDLLKVFFVVAAIKAASIYQKS